VKDNSSYVLYAVRSLFLCGEYVKHLAAEKDVAFELNAGGPDRISLAYWHRTLERCSPMGLDQFFRFLLEQQIISQHLAVAAMRYDGGSQRLRISIEEEGLILLATDKLPVPVTCSPQSAHGWI
jgi:hypothetical protein